MTLAAAALRERSLGVIGGLGPLASADFLLKLVEATEAHADAGSFDIVFEQRPFARAADPSIVTTARKLYIFDMIGDFRERGIGTVVLPCFLSHTFMEELQANSPLPIADMLEALRSHVRSHFPSVRRIGVLTSEPLREQRLFERYFSPHECEIVHPRWHGGQDGMTEAVFGANGIAKGNRRGHPIELLREACADLLQGGHGENLKGRWV